MLENLLIAVILGLIAAFVAGLLGVTHPLAVLIGLLVGLLYFFGHTRVQ